jgi:hypothetical protein
MSRAAFGPEIVGEQPIHDQGKPEPEGEELQIHKMSRNPSVTKCEVHYRGSDVPYISVYKVPVDENGEQVHPFSGLEDGDLEGYIDYDKPFIVRPHAGAYRWELVLDRRFAYDFASEEELRKVLPIIADAMAVAAGYTAHAHSNRIMPHGPEPTVMQSLEVIEAASIEAELERLRAIALAVREMVDVYDLVAPDWWPQQMETLRVALGMISPAEGLSDGS